VRGDVARLCKAKTTAEQERIWRKKLRPIIMSKILVKGFFGNP
jgi:betaine lipid synthase